MHFVRYFTFSVAALLIMNTAFYALINLLGGDPAFEEWNWGVLFGHLVFSLILGFMLAAIRESYRRESNDKSDIET